MAIDDDEPEDLDAFFEHLGERVRQNDPESYDSFRAAVTVMSEDMRRAVARSLVWHQETYAKRQWS